VQAIRRRVVVAWVCMTPDAIRQVMAIIKEVDRRFVWATPPRVP